ncbi:major facilitator superfamily domain-containing protein [Aspergillus crustosus]
MAELSNPSTDVKAPELQKTGSQDIDRGSIDVQDDIYYGKHGFAADEVRAALREYTPNTDLEKRMIRKVDLYQLPMLWLMCVLAYVDRNNIGNANAAGMSVDIGLSDNDYALLISIFFVGYLLWEVFSNIILYRTSPSWYLSCLMGTWGVITCAMSQVRNSRDIIVCRFFLGVIEAGFFPGVLYIMSCWYKSNEIGKRFSFFYTAICFAGAAAGLIAGAVISGLEGANGMEGWRWLFVIEGVVTVGVAIGSKFVLLDYPHSLSRRLTTEERAIAVARIMHDKKESTSNRKRLTSWQAFKASIADLRIYVFILVYIAQNSSTSITYFIPTVLKSMGYEGTAVQWMTVPIWGVGTVVLLVLPHTSDKYQERRWHIVGGLAVAWISAMVGLTIEGHDKVRYTFMCLYIGGLYPTAPLILSWASETLSLPAEKRAVSIAVLNSVAVSSGIYASYFWPSSDAPRYTTGFACVVSFIGLSLITASLVPVIFRYLPKYTTRAERELYGDQIARDESEGRA